MATKLHVGNLAYTTTADTLRGLQAEAALAEGTIAGLVNLLVGSLGGYLVESVLTAGTLIYLVLCLSIATIMARVERRYAIPGLIARVEPAA